eukprot:scaffold121205_cov38-Tisochrysis_lutea.AAC.1
MGNDYRLSRHRHTKLLVLFQLIPNQKASPPPLSGPRTLARRTRTGPGPKVQIVHLGRTPETKSTKGKGKGGEGRRRWSEGKSGLRAVSVRGSGR